MRRKVKISIPKVFIIFSIVFLFHKKMDAQIFESAITTLTYGNVSFNSTGNKLVYDSIGNIYILGHYRYTKDFDPGPSISNLTSQGGNWDIFIQKLDSNGNFVWAKSFGVTNGLGGSSMVIDDIGNLYIVGGFTGTVDFDPGVGTTNITSNGSYDGFVLKLDSNGDFVWVKSFGGTSSEIVHLVTLDLNYNIYISGLFLGTVDFDPGLGTSFLTALGGFDIFTLKLDNNGNYIWAKSIEGSATNDQSREILTDSIGNVYLMGYFEGTADFDPNAGTMNITSNGGADAFVQKMDSTGNLIWVKTFGNIAGERILSAAIDRHGNLYTTGVYYGTTDFDPDVGTTNLTSNGGADVFVQKLDSNGNFVWANSIGDLGNENIVSIRLDNNSNIYLAGTYEGTVDFDSGVGTTNLTSNGGADVFNQKIDSSGKFLWARSIGGTSSENVYESIITPSNKIYTLGQYFGTVDFDPNVGIANLTTGGFYLQKLGPCFSSFDSIVVTDCYNYTSPSGKLWDSTGVYSDTIPSYLGCDSIITINLTILYNSSTKYYVTNHLDSGCGTLRSFINQAISGDTIIIATDSILQLNQEILIDKDIILMGKHLTKSTINPNSNSRVFEIALNTNIEIRNIQFINGRNYSAAGGAIYCRGNLNLINCTFLNNYANAGGAISVSAFGITVKINSCEFMENDASRDGGAIFNAGNLEIFSSKFSQNKTFNPQVNTCKGGAIYNHSAGAVNILNCDFQNNQAEGDITSSGGVFYNEGNLNCLYTNFFENTSGGILSFSRYSYGGVIYNTGYANFKFCDFKNNVCKARTSSSNSPDNISYGGVVYNEGVAIFNNSGFSSNTLSCSVSSNSRAFARGGCFYNNDSIYVNNCSFYKNRVLINDWYTPLNIKSYSSGGFVQNNRAFILVNSSVSETYCDWNTVSHANPVEGSSLITMGNTIFANSKTTGPYIDDINSFNSLGYNMISRSNFTSSQSSDSIGTSSNPLNLQLDTMGYFGGATLNIGLLSNSPAINYGCPFAPTTDQRNFLRNGLADVGAHEYNGVNPCSNPIDSILVDNAICYDNNDGKIEIYTQSLSPYNLLWSNNETSLTLNDLYAGYYSYVLYDSSGCIFKDTVFVSEPTQILIANSNDTICQGDSILIYGKYENTAGVYYDTLQSTLGCDSILFKNLILNPVYLSNTNDTICQGDSVLIYGNYENTAGVYYDSLQTINGCDSVLSTTLSVNPVYLSNTNYTICQGDSILIYGNYENTAGVYYDTLQSILGCDSVLTTTLFLNANFNSSQNQEICQGDSALIYGTYQYTSGVYYDSLQTINGCDSVLSITLSVNPVYLSNTNDTICQGDSVLIYGKYENTAGVYYDTLQTIFGCDSVLTTTLFLNANFNSSQNQDICQGDSILIYGTYQNTSGVYYDSLQTINGCDSVLSTTLTVNTLPNVTLTNFNPDTICSSNSAVALPNGSPSGGVYSGAGVSGGTFDPNTAGIGTHSVIYTYSDANSCINSDSTFITVEQCVGIDDLANDLGILIYPNPNTGLFTIEKSSELDKEIRVNLLDASSRVIIDKIIPKGQQKVEMDITNYSKGVYYLQLTIGKEVFVKQILKN